MEKAPTHRPVLTKDRKFSQDNLWKIKDQNDPDAVITKKVDFFRWARDWGFAPPTAKDTAVSKYEYAVACSIQDQAANGYAIDVQKSRGENLVFRPRNDHRQISADEATVSARQVLGIRKP